MSKIKNFLKETAEDLRLVCIPALGFSSKPAARRIARDITGEHKVVLEYGAGNGIITREILKQAHPSARVFAIELKDKLIRDLKKIDDPRLAIIHGDVKKTLRDLNKLDIKKVDAVISGIPFSFLKKPVREEIIKDTYNALKPGGIFIAYQVTPALLPILKKIFKKEAEWYIAPLNVAMFVMIAQK